MGVPFRHSAGFGKRMEYYIIGLMLKEGLDIYVPLVDDDGIDAIIKKSDNTYCQIQIKSRSNDVKFEDAALFAGITHIQRENYWFIFYSERLSKCFILSSEDFINESVLMKSGKNAGKRTIKFNGMRKNKETGVREEYILERFKKYIHNDFQVFK